MRPDERAMLDAIRSAALGIAQSADTLLRQLEPVEAADAPFCQHREPIDVSTMGGPTRKHCRDCGLTYTLQESQGG